MGDRGGGGGWGFITDARKNFIPHPQILKNIFCTPDFSENKCTLRMEICLVKLEVKTQFWYQLFTDRKSVV